jgi:glycosyltransferase involved in cell wall biosynthesis
MKIVQLLPSLDIGGVERLAVDLACRQKCEGHQPVMFCTSHPGQFAPEAEAAGIPVRAFGKQSGPSLRLVAALAQALREQRADVLHAHNALVLHYGVVAARLAGVPVVVNTRHGGNLNWDPHCERIWRRAVPWADAVVFISEGVREYYTERDKLSSRNTCVIYNGIDLDKFAGRPLRSASDGFRFGAVGRLVPAKDHVTLVKAFALLADRMPNSELHLLGEGPCRSVIADTAASLGVQDRVVLHGASRDVAGFLSTLDLFVLSSIDEGLPISLMEALAAGLPVVSTSLPGLRELAPENVVAGYCPAGQPELLAGLMLQAAARPDLPAVGERARQWARRFGIDQTWHRYRDLFQEALLPKRRRQFRAA